MNNLLWIAGLLVVIWIVASVTKFVAGAILNLFWIIALVLVIIWAFRKLTGSRAGRV